MDMATARLVDVAQLRVHARVFWFMLALIDGCNIAYCGIQGSYGNECRPPFTCTNRLDEAGVACRCPRALSNCRTCDWGIGGTVCTQCQSSRFLWMGACQRSCPSGTTAIIPSVTPGIGRTCVAS
eukprot:m.409170 g.409170  ORF g.409170 m.409170 type:complete len:125 (+) comp21243_c1_seq4:1194-1568(+)